MKRETPDFDVALIDIDSMIYSISWVQANQRQREKMLLATVDKLTQDTEASESYAFIKGKNNFRMSVDLEYKANRKKYMEPEMLDRVEQLYDFARDVFISSDNGEADDYCSIYTYQALNEDKCPVVVHIDKDLNMIPGWHMSPKTGKFYFVSPQDAFVFMMKQLITGDGDDNVPGCVGIGPSTVNKIMQNKLLHHMKDTVLKTWKSNYTTGRGKDKGLDWYQRFLQSANCLILRESLDELRPFTEEEILKKMTWEATNERYMESITENTDLLEHALTVTPVGEMFQIGYIVKYKEDVECETLDTGKTPTSKEHLDGSPTTTTDLSTKSCSSSQESDTLERSPSTSTRKVNGSKKVTGGRTRAAVKNSTRSSKSTDRSASRSK